MSVTGLHFQNNLPFASTVFVFPLCFFLNLFSSPRLSLYFISICFTHFAYLTLLSGKEKQQMPQRQLYYLKPKRMTHGRLIVELRSAVRVPVPRWIHQPDVDAKLWKQKRQFYWVNYKRCGAKKKQTPYPMRTHINFVTNAAVRVFLFTLSGWSSTPSSLFPIIFLSFFVLFSFTHFVLLTHHFSYQVKSLLVYAQYLLSSITVCVRCYNRPCLPTIYPLWSSIEDVERMMRDL